MRRLNAALRFRGCRVPQLLHCQVGSRLSFALTVWQLGAGFAGWEKAVGEADLTVLPRALVDDLALDLAHAGIGLSLGGFAVVKKVDFGYKPIVSHS